MRLHIHTDGPFFSGAENMIANFLNSEEFVREFDVTFSYRRSLEYDRGLAERVHTCAEIHPLDLLDLPSRTDPLPTPARQLAKLGAYATGEKYRDVRTNTARIEAVLRQTRPDVLHVNSGGYPGAYSTLAAVLAARNAGVAHTVYVANNIAMPYTWRRALDRPLDRKVAAAVELFVTGSSHAGKALAAVLDLPREKLRTIPNGIRPRDVTEPAGDVRTRIGAPEGRPLVAVVANLEARKGHRHLLGALALLKSRGFAPLPWIAIEGVGPEEAALREMVAARSLSGDVAFLGREARVFDLMNASDLLALPSVANEDFPNVILEAMSLGKPVVASRIAGTPEQVVDRVTGLLVEPGDVGALAEALAAMSSSPEDRLRMGEAGRERFEVHFTADRSVAAYSDLYRELCRR